MDVPQNFKGPDIDPSITIMTMEGITLDGCQGVSISFHLEKHQLMDKLLLIKIVAKICWVFSNELYFTFIFQLILGGRLIFPSL